METGMAKIWRSDGDDLYKAVINQARTNSPLDSLQLLICCYHRRQRCIVAVIEYLVQLLLRPFGIGLRAEIIKDKYRCISNLVEALIESDI